MTAITTNNYVNTTSVLSTGVTGLQGASAKDTLAVIAHYPGINLLKQVSSSAGGPWTSYVNVSPASNVYYKFSVENIGDVDLENVYLTDPNISLAGCPLSLPFTLTTTNPVASCILSPVPAGSGDHLNTATIHSSYNSTPYSSISTAEYFGVTLSSSSGLTLEKQVGTSETGPWTTSSTGVPVDSPIYYKFLVMNSGNTSMSGLSIIDSKVNTSTCQLIDPLAPSSATFCVIGPIPAATGTITNTASVSSTSPGYTSLEANAIYTTGDYSISGTAWEDKNTDGIINGTESGLYNVIVDLYLDDGNGTFSTSDDTHLGTQYTDANGNYSFTTLPGGNYYVYISGGITGYTLVSGGSNPRPVPIVPETVLETISVIKPLHPIW